jgi:hypothetical protein
LAINQFSSVQFRGALPTVMHADGWLEAIYFFEVMVEFLTLLLSFDRLSAHFTVI